ncbi:MAG: hypothetical protein VKK59_05635 [Vampirovibrionales bacterium]|nr:hypothetical protein [Vampirovibrionales bacterium]
MATYPAQISTSNAILPEEQQPKWVTTADIFDLSGQFLLLKKGSTLSDDTIDKLRGFGIAPRLKPLYLERHTKTHTSPIHTASGQNLHDSKPDLVLSWPHVAIMTEELSTLQRCSFWLKQAGLPASKIHHSSTSDSLCSMVEKYAVKAVILPTSELAVNLPRIKAVERAPKSPLQIVAMAAAHEGKSILKRRQWQALIPTLGLSDLWFEPLDKRAILPWAKAHLNPLPVASS